MELDLSIKSKRLVIIDGKKYLEVEKKDGSKVLKELCQ